MRCISSSLAVALFSLLLSAVPATASRRAEPCARRRGPDFNLPGVDGRSYRLQDFAEGPDPGRHLYVQPLPDGPGYEDRIISCTPITRTVASRCAISPNDPLRVRLDELGYIRPGRSFEDMKVRAKARTSASPTSTTAPRNRRRGLRRPGHAARVHFRRERKLPLQRPPRRREVKEVKSHDTATRSRPCSPAGRCRWRRRGFSLPRRSGRDKRRTPPGRWRAGQEPVTLGEIDDAGVAKWSERHKEAPGHQRLGDLVWPVRGGTAGSS